MHTDHSFSVITFSKREKKGPSPFLPFKEHSPPFLLKSSRQVCLKPSCESLVDLVKNANSDMAGLEQNLG